MSLRSRYAGDIIANSTATVTKQRGGIRSALIRERLHEPSGSKATPHSRLRIPYFYLVNSESFVLAMIAEITGFGFSYGTIPTFYTENFYRASGASAAYQIARLTEAV
jgi:hypothetical protein